MGILSVLANHLDNNRNNLKVFPQKIWGLRRFLKFNYESHDPPPLALKVPNNQPISPKNTVMRFQRSKYIQMHSLGLNRGA